MCLLVSRIDASSQDLLHLADLLHLLAAEQLPSARAMICGSATKLPIAGRLHLTAVSQASRVSKNKAFTNTAYHKLKNEICRDISAAPTSDPRSRQLKRWLAWDRELATPVICVTTGRRKVHTHYSAALAPGNRRGSLGRGVLLLPVSSKLKVDMDKLFGMAGYKTKASTNTAYHKLKAKIKSVSAAAEADEAEAEDSAVPSSPVKKSRGKKAVPVKAESDSEDDDDEADEIAPTKPTASGRSSRVTANKHAALKAKMAARPSIGRATRASARTNKVDVQMSEDSSWVQAIEEVAWPGTVHTDQHFKPS
ncbi:hypothetical protein VTO58DRAFT_103231 [Aureobasidium pullulans]